MYSNFLFEFVNKVDDQDFYIPNLINGSFCLTSEGNCQSVDTLASDNIVHR